MLENIHQGGSSHTTLTCREHPTQFDACFAYRDFTLPCCCNSLLYSLLHHSPTPCRHDASNGAASDGACWRTPATNGAATSPPVRRTTTRSTPSCECRVCVLTVSLDTHFLLAASRVGPLCLRVVHADTEAAGSESSVLPLDRHAVPRWSLCAVCLTLGSLTAQFPDT